MVLAEDCPEENSVGSIVLGSVLTVGIFLSYLPQHVAIIRSKTSDGLSLTMILLSNLSALSILLSSVLGEWDLYACCTVVGAAQCQRILLELYQLLVGFINLLPMYAFAIYYHPYGPRNIDRYITSVKHSSVLDAEQSARKRYLFDVIVFLSYMVVTVVFIMVSVLLAQSLGSKSASVKTLLGIMGIISIVSTFLIWLPQIYSVYTHKGGGSLSVLMLLLQAPGALAVVIYQGFLQKAGWGVWVPYMAVFIQEVIILCQIFFYWWRARNSTFKSQPPDMMGLLDVDSMSDLIESSEASVDLSSEDSQDSNIMDILSRQAQRKEGFDLNFIQPPTPDDDLYDQVFESDDD